MWPTFALSEEKKKKRQQFYPVHSLVFFPPLPKSQPLNVSKASSYTSVFNFGGLGMRLS